MWGDVLVLLTRTSVYIPFQTMHVLGIEGQKPIEAFFHRMQQQFVGCRACIRAYANSKRKLASDDQYTQVACFCHTSTCADQEEDACLHYVCGLRWLTQVA